MSLFGSDFFLFLSPQVAKALANLCICIGSHELSSLVYDYHVPGRGFFVFFLIFVVYKRKMKYGSKDKVNSYILTLIPLHHSIAKHARKVAHELSYLFMSFFK